ncbi:hypothetical protein K4L06_16845 [Lysobacter sp. BMK333-48F3]|uniref:DUF6988 family protein n=1 Tax=Lysobacter sp. BMK333-48F3 TaxID=2867962 RepID=UPI001C8BC461|nr:hypothetical protein [Lysobacter sp. BMK333-48F3]MBX9402978.1 hypothetical protein [Lysobacter sp. BMK333-48F3]
MTHTAEPELAARVRRTEALQRRYAAEFARLQAPPRGRYSVAHSCLELALEYQAAIAAAVGDGRNAAALTLLRALIETVFRALWLVYAAAPDQLAKLAQGRLKPDLSDFTRSLRSRKQVYPQLAQFATDCEGRAGIFNSLAHAGNELLVRQKTGYDPNESLATLDFADSFLVLSGEIAAIVHDDDALLRLSAKLSPGGFGPSVPPAAPGAPAVEPNPARARIGLPPRPDHRDSA